ncbi:MAG TPA: ABC transporter permease [Terriglobia bacterium]|nr:ABC transporter permease [Terriglobia bacterium]
MSAGSMETILLDIRFGLRTMVKIPGFTTMTILTLAIGIGANTAMFGIVDSVIIRPLPYPDSDRLVVVWEKPPNRDRNAVSAANFLDWRDQNSIFENLVATVFRSFNLSGKDQPEQVQGMRVSWDFFGLLGTKPSIGRGFVPNDDRPGSTPVTVLSNGLWQRKFGGDPNIAGRFITVDGESCMVIGIMPASFRFFGNPDMWMPLALDRARATRDFHWLVPLARLRQGVSLKQARAEMAIIARNIERDYPLSNKGWSTFVQPIRNSVVQEGQRDRVLVLFGAVGFVLLIACVNVANLLLTKGVVRRRELALRMSLGAGRLRLMQQLLTESLLLATAGGLLGLGLAFWLVRLVRALLPPFLVAGIAEISVDWRVLVFALLLSIVTGLFFGAAPAWRATKVNLHDSLKEASRATSSGSGSTRFRNLLVTTEIALSLVVLIAAGLMTRTLIALQTVNPGFRTDHLLSMHLSMPFERYPVAPQVRSFYRRLIDKVGKLPGVQSVSISMTLPLQGSSFGLLFQIANHAQVPPSEAPGAQFEMVSSDYFGTFGIPLRQGRLFMEADNENAPRVAIVNETFARQFLSEEKPLGQRLLIRELISGKAELGPLQAWEIVGVTKDVKFGSLNDNSLPTIYVPIMQCSMPGVALALRTGTEPKSLALSVRNAIAEVDSDLPITGMKTMEEVVAETTLESRTQTWLIGVFAIVALALATLGIYGVMSYSVMQATRDIGVRMALGAQEFDVLKLVLGKGILLIATGLAVGLGGAVALTRLLSTLLFGIKATDLLTFSVMTMFLGSTALLACYIPARRATRMKPIEALRHE